MMDYTFRDRKPIVISYSEFLNSYEKLVVYLPKIATLEYFFVAMFLSLLATETNKIIELKNFRYYTELFDALLLSHPEFELVRAKLENNPVPKHRYKLAFGIQLEILESSVNTELSIETSQKIDLANIAISEIPALKTLKLNFGIPKINSSSEQNSQETIIWITKSNTIQNPAEIALPENQNPNNTNYSQTWARKEPDMLSELFLWATNGGEQLSNTTSELLQIAFLELEKLGYDIPSAILVKFATTQNSNLYESIKRKLSFSELSRIFSSAGAHNLNFEISLLDIERIEQLNLSFLFGIEKFVGGSDFSVMLHTSKNHYLISATASPDTNQFSVLASGIFQNYNIYLVKTKIQKSKSQKTANNSGEIVKGNTEINNQNLTQNQNSSQNQQPNSPQQSANFQNTNHQPLSPNKPNPNPANQNLNNPSKPFQNIGQNPNQNPNAHNVQLPPQNFGYTPVFTPPGYTPDQSNPQAPTGVGVVSP